MLFDNNLLLVFAIVLGWGLTIYLWMVVIRAVISWVNPSPGNPAVRFLTRATDPPMFFIRRYFPVWVGGIDLSPIILILLLIFANDFIITTFKALAQGAKISVVFPIVAISVINLVRSLLFVVMILVIARAVISWISPDPYNRIVQFIYGITEPMMRPVRQRIPLVFSGMDFTPILILAIIYFAIAILDRAMMALGGIF